MIGTYRDSDMSHVHPLLDTLAALHRQPDVSRSSFPGWTTARCWRSMEAAAGHALTGSAVRLAHTLYRETDGNPFFVSEVLRHLTETGAILQDETGRWMARNRSTKIALPDTIREVVGARIGRLGKEAARILGIAAVIGRDFDLDLLARATNTSQDEVLDILDAAAGAALVREHRRRRSLQLRPRPDPACALWGPRADTPGDSAPGGGRGARGALRGSTGNPDR